jgi:hypothetical protein
MLIAGALVIAGAGAGSGSACSSSLTARDAGTDVVADAGSGACASIAGKTFVSLNTMECGLTPTGVAMCNWSITFATDGTFSWRHSDVGESGTYTCSGATITGNNGISTPRTGMLDPQTNLLTWEGAQYAASQ